ncbi:MAG: ABC transporter permease [Bacillota bacterium]|nr:ABC transporter permease [Bacillota bacterium]
MLRLMKLEIKKFKVRGYIRGTIIANFIILAFMLMAVFSLKGYKEIPLHNYSEMFLATSTFVRATFCIFAAVMISKFIIAEYTNKTINVMFIYPIKRINIMLAKLLVVVVFIFTAMIISNIFINSILYIVNSYGGFFRDTLTADMVFNNLVSVLIYSIGYTLLALIPLYIGMIKKSTSATIVSSVILVSLLDSSGSKGESLGSIIIIPMVLGIIGAITAYMAIKDVETKDIAN